MVRERRKEREQNKNITKGFRTFRVLCVFCVQITYLKSVFICFYLWTFFLTVTARLKSKQHNSGDIKKARTSRAPEYYCYYIFIVYE